MSGAGIDIVAALRAGADDLDHIATVRVDGWPYWREVQRAASDARIAAHYIERLRSTPSPSPVESEGAQVSVPLPEWEALDERLRRAEFELTDLSIAGHVSDAERNRLAAKASGVALARSYVNEVRRAAADRGASR